ncbi:MAG: helix-turn-helix domain-containing protein [Planctomycetota bacterium]|jgi:hypothetical protein
MFKLVTSHELAGILRVTPETVRTWARRKWIPCLRASRRPVLFDLKEVEEVLRARAAKRKREVVA